MRRLPAALAALVLTAATPGAQGPPDVAALLAADPTPGGLALLVEHGTRAEVPAHLARQLTHARPEVRAAAARVLLALNAGARLPDLLAALETETSADAAAELTRAVAILAGPAHDRSLLAVWPRLGADGAGLSAVTYARTRGPVALDAFPAFRALQPSRRALTAFIEGARPDAAALDGLLERALAVDDALTFRAALAAAETLRQLPAPARLVAGLAAARPPEMRLEAAHAALARWSGEAPLPPAVIAALAIDAPFGADPESPDAAVVGELAARAAGRRLAPAPAWRRQVDAPGPMLASLFRSAGVRSLLTDAERRRLNRALPHAAGSGPPPAPPAPTTAVLVQLADTYPRGFVSGVLAATGCDLSKARRQGIGAGAGELVMRRDGRPSGIGPVDTGVAQDACRQATLVLLKAHVADTPPVAVGERRLVVIPLDPDYPACRDSASNDLAEAATSDARRVTPPKKTRHVDPGYPESALRARVDGLVGLEATISATGCVARLRVVRSVDPRLDLAALLAVMRWRFSPTLVDDRPVAVTMAVTVSFTVR